MSTTTLTSSGLVVALTTVSQTRGTLINGGAPSYSVTSVTNSGGMLPDLGIFLNQIVVNSDPSQDILVRTSTVPDLNAYPNSRLAAILDGTQFYRSSTNTSYFTDITLASAFVQTTKDSLNELVSDYITFTFEFSAVPPGAQYVFPNADLSTNVALVNSFVAAQNGLNSANANVTTATSAVASATSVLATANANLTSVKTLQTAIDGIATQSSALNNFITAATGVMGQIGTKPSIFPSIIGSGTGIYTDLNTLIYSLATDAAGPGLPLYTAAAYTLWSPAGGVGIASIDAVGTALNSALTTAISEYSNTAAAVAAASAAVSTASTTVSTANSSVNTAQGQLTTANANQIVAQSTYNNALAACVAALPGFNPANPQASL